ncbi:MAG TPA: hypothetical protein VF045_07245 [Acidimicrobiales bacterium]
MRTPTSGRVLLTAGLLAAVTVLGACDSGGGDDGPEVADLGTVIVSDTPPGYVPITESFGPFDLDQYIERFSSSEESDRDELGEVGFERGYARGWINPEGTGLVVFVFETESNGDAEHLMEYFIDDAKDSRDGQEFDVEGIDGAEGVTYVETSIDGGETVHGVLFVRGKRLYLTASQHSELASGRETILQFARTQAQLAK